MIRASGVHRICTHRLEDNTQQLNSVTSELKDKVEKKKLIFNIENIDEYLTTQGLITVAKDYVAEWEKYKAWLRDDIPAGAKTYMKELWLQNNYNFIEFSLNEEGYATRKGTIVEDEAIKLIGSYYNLLIDKNTERQTKGFLSGEADIIYDASYGKIIRDNKSPISWTTFKNKLGITTDYYWQLIAYCYLYDAVEAYLDYTFMPTPNEILEEVKLKLSEEEYQAHLKMNESIESLDLSKRIKTFSLNCDIADEIKFMLTRVEKCEQYYNTLTYESCMNIKDEQQ